LSGNVKAPKGKCEEMTIRKEVDASRRMGTSAFKKEINHLLHARGHIEGNDGFNTGWNSRDHALVMALLLKRKGTFPKIASGKCMYLQGPYLRYSSIGVGQEHDHVGGHSWVVDPTFGLIDVSPVLQIKKRKLRATFDGVFGRVWQPTGKDRVRVVVCDDADTYEQETEKATRLTGQTTAVYVHLEDFEVTDSLIESPFKYLNSDISEEIKKRFGAEFYPAVASHLQRFMLGETDSLTGIEELEAWNLCFQNRSVSP
jgi:hypothetical protein